MKQSFEIYQCSLIKQVHAVLYM